MLTAPIQTMSPLRSFLIIFSIVLVYGAIHSWLASTGVKSWAKKRFGTAAARLYRLAFNAFAVVSFLPALAAVPLLADHSLYQIPYPWLLLPLGIQGLAGLVLLAGLLQTGVRPFLGLQQLAAPHSVKEDALVVDGLYRWVRHPLYSAGLVFIWLSPVMTTNILALNLGLTIYIVAGAILEERKLLRQFGEVYAQYRRQTPMLAPWPRKRSQ